MFLKFAKKIFGSANDRFISKLQSQVDSINKLEKEYEKLTNQELKNKTKDFKARLKEKETLEFLSNCIITKSFLSFPFKPQLPVENKTPLILCILNLFFLLNDNLFINKKKYIEPLYIL